MSRPLLSLARRLARPLARLAARSGAARTALEQTAKFAHLVLGRGAGAGWDLAAEAAAAAHVLGPLDARRPLLVLDVGAHRGEWTDALRAALPGRALSVWQVEPNPACAVVLRAKADGHVRVVEAVASEAPGRAVLLLPDVAPDVASLHARREPFLAPHTYREVEVAAVTLDALLEEAGQPEVDLLKLDVEGHEVAVLRGTERALAARRIRAIQFEFGSGNVNSRTFFHDLWDLLAPHGFRLWRIAPGGVLLPVERYTEAEEYYHAVTNFLALRTSAA